METKIKLRKVEAGGYETKATYEWEGHTIEGDAYNIGAGWGSYWYCDTLFKGSKFRTLRGLKHAIQLKVDGKLNKWNLMSCEDE
jgi:hypothetical protein